MIKNYGLYNYHDKNATVLILFSNLEINKKVNGEEVNVLYHDEIIVGYEINDFIRYAKIKYSGIIFLPSNPLIDVINAILDNNNLENIDYKKESGYITKLNNNKMMVYAKQGTFLRDESISEGRYCTYHDLYIEVENENDLIIIDEDIKEGVDFFLSEEK